MVIDHGVGEFISIWCYIISDLYIYFIHQNHLHRLRLSHKKRLISSYSVEVQERKNSPKIHSEEFEVDNNPNPIYYYLIHLH